jgi:hypothetical protein
MKSAHDYHRPDRCRHCNEKVLWLFYDGTGRKMCFDPVSTNHNHDPLATKYVMYTHPETSEDRARLESKTEPWDPDTEFWLRPHILTCIKHPRGPAGPNGSHPMKEHTNA